MARALRLAILVLVLTAFLHELHAHCVPIVNYGDSDFRWEMYVGKIGSKKRMLCAETDHTVHKCCVKETRTSFEGCELADETGENPRCWGNKKVQACCIPE